MKIKTTCIVMILMVISLIAGIGFGNVPNGQAEETISVKGASVQAEAVFVDFEY